MRAAALPLAVREDCGVCGVCSPSNLTRAEVDWIYHPRPPWERGWTATRGFTRGGGPGEGVKTDSLILNWSVILDSFGGPALLLLLFRLPQAEGEGAAAKRAIVDPQ